MRIVNFRTACFSITKLASQNEKSGVREKVKCSWFEEKNKKFLLRFLVRVRIMQLRLFDGGTQVGSFQTNCLTFLYCLSYYSTENLDVASLSKATVQS